MSAARTERLLNLLTLLLNTRRPISLRQIREMEEFNAYSPEDPKSGERAFERDKAALIELGVPLRWVAPEAEDDDEGSGGYVIDRDRYYLPAIDLSPSDLAVLSIAGAAALAISGFPGRDAVVRALAKLGFDVDEERDVPTLAHTPTPGPHAERTTANLEILQDAVAQAHTVDLVYEGAQGERAKRRVSPYGLYYRRGAWYLVGHCHARQAQRTFHLGRMDEVQLVSGKPGKPEFEVPKSFDLNLHVSRRPWEFPSEPKVTVVIRLAERLVPAIGEIFGRRARVETTPNGTFVHLEVTHRAALIAAVLPYGDAAEVVEPLAIRQQILRIYEDLATRYSHPVVSNEAFHES